MSNYKKYVLTAIGVFIFLVAGMSTMVFDISWKTKHSPIQHIISENQATEAELKSADNKLTAQKPEKISSDKNKIAEKEKSDWYIYVTGAVKNPGVYKVSPDSRIFQAVEAAGGFTDKADMASINLAQHLIDGFQINISEKTSKKINTQTQTVKNSPVIIPGTPPKTVNFVPVTPAVKNLKNVKNSDGRIDINSASEKELENLNGVGPAIAKRIVEYRNANGKFKSPDDLINVKGIGEAKLKKMRPQILIR